MIRFLRILTYRARLKNVRPRLQEFFRKMKADVVSNSRNKIHKT